MSKYKIVDRKAPRYRQSKYRHNLINTDLYRDFKDETGIDISWKEFRQINEYINLEIRDLALNTRDGTMLPKQMGHLWLGLFPPKGRLLDEPYARNTGNHGTQFSFHTSGMQGKIVWDFVNVKYKVKNFMFYGFVGHRDFKTLASKQFYNSPETYMRINLITRRSENYKRLKLENEQNAQRNYLASEDTE